MHSNATVAVITSLLGAVACDASGPPADPTCLDAKCDLPDDPVELACVRRRADAFNENQLAFTERFLRWSCADTEGVTGVDRGQEYCEYFAIVKLPPAAADDPSPAPSIHGRLVVIPPEDLDDPDPAPDYETTPEEVLLSPDQILELEQDPTAVIGQCVFTSWNEDIPAPAPTCEDEGAIAGGFGSSECPGVLGVPLDEENFRMKFEVNSAEAAQVLVEDCYEHPEGGDPDDPHDFRHDDFLRGCFLNAEINETEFRKSDSVVCAAAVRLAECGCFPVERSHELPEILSPWDRRGFPLGTWSGAYELPAGCRYVEPGDGSRTIVACDLTAQEILTYPLDPKGYCREKYGPNVVVHVPIPGHAIACYPELSSSPYAAACDARPWVLTAY
jgi:hypothetical protein